MIPSEMLQIITMSGVVGVVLGSSGMFAFCKKKGVDIPKVIKTINQTADVVAPAIEFAKTIAPNNPIVNIADFIEKWAKTGAKNADQLYYSSQLSNDTDRNTTAKETVYAALKELGITPTQNQQKLIDDTIEAAVLDLGHNKTDAEKESEKQALQAQVSQLTTERDTLKNTIATITTAASTVQVATLVTSNTVQTA